MIKLLRFMKPYRMIVVLVLVLAFAQSMANLYLPTLMADIVDKGIVTGDTGYIWRTGGLMLLVTIGGVICAIIGSFYAARVATGFGKIIRAQIFNRVAKFSLHEFDKMSTDSLITRTTNDTTQVQQVWIVILGFMITAPMMMIGGIILAIAQDATLSWILVVVIPILVAAIVIIMRKAIPLFRVMQVKLDKLNLILDEGLSGVRVIRAFDRMRYEERRFDEANLDLTDVAIRVNRITAWLMPIMMLVLNISSVAILWFGAIRINNNQMQVGALIAFLQYAMQILFGLLMVSMLFILIPRFYDIDSGHILVDGVDVREMAQKDLRAKIGFVPQKAVLFSGTIAENIRYGKEDASDEEVHYAAEVAQATEFISEMKDGYDSAIAQGGTNVSGGQKQRLSIARALVRNPEIYVFDDTFSALDFKTDAQLRAALKRETLDSTVLIVAQRVSTVMDADQIIVLDEGRIAGIGTHRALMRSSEVYREIVTSQLSMEEIAEEIA